jgi:ElaB/YqjD/DUF883 family membrane-anchored ribosome-binding protein
MIKSPIDADDVLKKMASESVKQGENIRTTIRDLTLKALQARELSLAQIKSVLASVTQGVNLGAVKSKIDTDKLLTDAFAGMDDALLKAAQASHIAMQQLTNAGEDFEQSHLKKALGDLEHFEDELLKTVKQASGDATEKVRAQWAHVLGQMKIGGTETGAQVATTMEQFGQSVQDAMRQQREAGLKAAHLLGQNFATLASGVLMGLSEGVQQRGTPKSGKKES